MKEHNLWQNSLSRGSAAENFVVETLFPSIGIKALCNNNANKDSHGSRESVDIRIFDLRVDVKVAFTPYPSKITPSGLNNDEHLTIDFANIEKYDRCTLLLFLVRYDKPRVLLISAGAIKDIIHENPGRIYSRSARSMKDKQKKIGISILECEDITHFFPNETILQIYEI